MSTEAHLTPLLRCSSLLADTYAAVESAPSIQSSEAILPLAEEVEDHSQTVVLRATDATSTKSTPRQNVSTAGEDGWVEMKSTCAGFDENHGAPWTQTSKNVVLLVRAGEVLRRLGPHPALATVLRKTAGAWVRQWTGSNTPLMGRLSPGRFGYSGKGEADQGSHADKEDFSHRSCAVRSETSPTDHRHQPWGFLENAAACLAEARNLLSSLVASAEPVVDVLSTSSVIAHKIAPSNSAERDAGALKSNKSPPKAGLKKEGAGKDQTKVKKSDSVKNGAVSQDSAVPSSMQASGAVSTPLGRALVMVELEEACVRSMLGRAKGEARSEEAAREAAANDESITPVQR